MIKLKELLSEGKHEFGCVMLYTQFPAEIIKLQDTILPSDLYTEEGNTGIELEPHCTLLYGLHEGVTLEDVTKVLDKYTFSDLKAYEPSLFENEKFDVLKYDIGYPTRSGAFLHKCNTDLSKYPNTQKFPNYHPHMTVAYLKPGKGQKYLEYFKKYGANEFITTPTHGVYSEANGNHTEIKIKLK
jgi:2'-5' RNA ligase